MSLLFDEPYYYPGGDYERIKTKFSEPIKGEARPGIEPELKPVSHYSIFEVKRFDLRSEVDWDYLLVIDPIIYLAL